MELESTKWQIAIGTGLVLALAALAGGYLGWLHPAGDTLAVGRGIAAVAVVFMAVLATLSGLRIAAFGALLIAMLAGGQIALAYFWPGVPGEFLVYQKNIRFDNPTLDLLAADIRESGAHVVTLQELSDANLTLLTALSDTYPTQFRCEGRAVGGTAILSRLAAVEGTGFCAPGLSALQVVSGKNRVWIVSVHLQWPWPHEQARQVRMLLPILAKLEGKAVIAGDFNMVRWGSSVTQIGSLLRLQPAGPTLGSYTGFAPWHLLPIDHVLSPGGGRATARPALGSDHLGILAGVEL